MRISDISFCPFCNQKLVINGKNNVFHANMNCFSKLEINPTFIKINIGYNRIFIYKTSVKLLLSGLQEIIMNHSLDLNDPNSTITIYNRVKSLLILQ